MRRTIFGGVLTLVAIAMLGVTGCGGDDDDSTGDQTSDIRTNQGLSVAALAAELAGGASIGDAADEDSAARNGVGAPEAADAQLAESTIGKDIAPYGGFPAQAGGYDGITV